MFNEIASVIIHRPIEDVYAFMSQPKNRLVYDPDLLDVRQTPEGPLRMGTQIVEVRSMLGRKGEMVTEVSELDPNRRIGYRSRKDDPMNAFGHYQFESAPEGTRLTLNFTLAPKGLMQLVVPLLATRLRRDIQAGVQRIKTTLEKPN
ncbi:MAG TPA: SRPBCC family protein [Anaerolineales bacterium]|jgi:uncharacterized membrane protein|nr:SRPBCC family protein [Anaerolineales bacterium]